MADALECEELEAAPLTAQETALCTWALKMTLQPGEMKGSDIEALGEVGWSDEEIQDAAQVVAYFNYINRLANGLGVDPEPQ